MFTRAGDGRCAARAGGVGLGEVLSASWFFGKSAPRTGARVSVVRCEVQLRPDRLARVRSLGDTPAVGERLDEDETSARLGVGGGILEAGWAVPAGVGDLDAQGVRDDVEGEPEVPAGDAAVCGRVGREFRDDLACGVQRESPGAELLGGEQAGETGSAWRRGQLHAEVADEVVGLGLGSSGFLDHVTQSGRACLL
jgi:hypothetical protein